MVPRARPQQHGDRQLQGRDRGLSEGDPAQPEQSRRDEAARVGVREAGPHHRRDQAVRPLSRAVQGRPRHRVQTGRLSRLVSLRLPARGRHQVLPDGPRGARGRRPPPQARAAARPRAKAARRGDRAIPVAAEVEAEQRRVARGVPQAAGVGRQVPRRGDPRVSLHGSAEEGRLRDGPHARVAARAQGSEEQGGSRSLRRPREAQPQG